MNNAGLAMDAVHGAEEDGLEFGYAFGGEGELPGGLIAESRVGCVEPEGGHLPVAIEGVDGTGEDLPRAEVGEGEGVWRCRRGHGLILALG